MRELLEFIALMKERDADIGEVIPVTISELRSRGLHMFDEGLTTDRGVSSFFHHIDPKPPACDMQAADVVVRHQQVEVKLYNADGEHYASRWPRETRPVTKTVRVDRQAYMDANTPAERALVRACDAFDKRSATRPKNHFLGRIKTLHGQLTRAGLKASNVDALCTMVRDVCRGDSDSVCFKILADLKASENKLETSKLWLKQFFAIRKAVSDEDAKLDRYTFESLEGTARAMGTNVELLLQHGAYLGVVTGHLYDEMPEDGEEQHGDFFIERVTGDHIWNTRRAQMVERVEEEDLLRRHNVKSRSVPIIVGDNVEAPRRDVDGEFELPVWDIITTRISDGAMFFNRAGRSYHDMVRRANAIREGGKFSVRFQRARTAGPGFCDKCQKSFGDYIHHMRVKHGVCVDVSQVKTFPLMQRATTLGQVTERPGWHIGCDCGHYQSAPVNIMGDDWKPMPELADISLTDILGLACLDDMTDTRFRNPEWVPGYDEPFYLNAQAVKLLLTNVCGLAYLDLVKECVAQHTCQCGNPLSFHRHGKAGRDGRFWPEMVRCLDTSAQVFDVGTVENNTIVAHETKPDLVGSYVENVGDTWLVLKADWVTRHPKVLEHIAKVQAAPSLVKEHSNALRLEAAADLNHQEMRMFESVLNAEVRNRMLTEALESEYVQGFMRRMFNASHGDFYAVRNQVLRGLFARNRSGAEKDFCFAFMNALEEELRAEALTLLTECGETENFTVLVAAIKEAGYVAYQELSSNLDVAPVPSHEHFLLHQVSRARRQQLLATAQPTETRNKWRALIQSGDATPNQVKAITIAAGMARDHELRKLAVAAA